jgi:hypothetical protein
MRLALRAALAEVDLQRPSDPVAHLARALGSG